MFMGLSIYEKYQNVIGRYQSIMEREKKDLGQCPNDKPHRGVEEQRVLRTTDKGGRCLNTCFSNNQNLLHDSVATHLSKALHGGHRDTMKSKVRCLN